MNAFTSFKVLTLASLLVYSAGDARAQGQGLGAGQGVVVTNQDRDKINKSDSETRSAQCIFSFNSKLSGLTQMPDSLNKLGIPDKPIPADVLSKAQEDPEIKDAVDEFRNCISNRTPPVKTNTDAQCSKEEDNIREAAKELTKQCKYAPKVSSDDDDVVDTATSTAGVKHSDWRVCLQDAYSCQNSEFGADDSGHNCVDDSLEDIAKRGGGTKEKTDYCKKKYPPQCGIFDSSNLLSRAKDMRADLNTELKDLQPDIAQKKVDIQDNQDKLNSANERMKALPAKQADESKQAQKQYEAAVAASNSRLDATLESFYKTIINDQNAAKTLASAVTIADAARFDAQNKFMIACKAQATAYANNQVKPGAVNYGGTKALVTNSARRADAYTLELQRLYDDGITCDGGNYANAQLAFLNAQKSLADGQAQIQKDQAQLAIGLQQVASKKGDASYQALMDQSDKIVKLAAAQKAEYEALVTETKKYRDKAIQLQTELQKLEAKVVAGDTKKQCIQTLQSCAALPGVPSGSSSKEAPDLTESPDLLNKLISACQSAAKPCSGNDPKWSDKAKAKNLTDFRKDYSTFADPPDNLLPVDPGSSEAICLNAVAGKMEEQGPPKALTAAQRRAATLKGTSDVGGRPVLKKKNP